MRCETQNETNSEDKQTDRRKYEIPKQSKLDKNIVRVFLIVYKHVEK